MTGDSRKDFEDMHPDEHAIAFAQGNPDIAFVGSDGGIIRTDGKFGNASSQCDSRGLERRRISRTATQWLSQVPNRLITMNAGLRTLQFESIAVDPQQPARRPASAARRTTRRPPTPGTATASGSTR